MQFSALKCGRSSSIRRCAGTAFVQRQIQTLNSKYCRNQQYNFLVSAIWTFECYQEKGKSFYSTCSFRERKNRHLILFVLSLTFSEVNCFALVLIFIKNSYRIKGEVNKIQAVKFGVYTAVENRVNIKVIPWRAMKAQKGSGGRALLVFNLGGRCRWVVNATPRSSYTRKRAPVPILEEDGWALGSLDPNGVKTLNRPSSP